MNNVYKRIFTGILLASGIIGCITLGAYGLLFLTLTINLLGLQEFYGLFRSETLLPRFLTGILLGSLLILSCFLFAEGFTDHRVFIILIPFTFAIFAMELFLKAENPFLNIAITLVGVLAISAPLSLFLLLAFLSPASSIYHPEIILGVFFLLWSVDCGAYFWGKWVGKRPLFTRISPHKTWEGSLGGAICGFSTAYLISLWYRSYSLKEWMIITGIILVTGTLGDLIKSLMKRSLHIKDSGTLLPGHGGILDRFDTLLGSAAFIYGFLVLKGNA